MKYIYDKDIIRELNINLLDYGFEKLYEEVNSNGIMRIYKDETLFEGFTLSIKLDFNGINAKLIADDNIIFADELGMDIIKMFAMDRINLTCIIDIIIEVISNFLTDLEDLRERALRGEFNE